MFKILVLFIAFVHGLAEDQLMQILLLSRPNVRAPVVNLDVYSSKEWLKWGEALGHLTTKGAMLEEYLGEYFSDYFIQEKILTSKCPDDTLVHVYANSVHRTRKTAKHFVRTAFRGCNLTINLQPDNTPDPVFQTVILNDTETFRSIALKEMKEKLDQLDFKEVYTRLNTILDIKTSDLCLLNNLCDLTKGQNNITLNLGLEPIIFGPFKVGYEVADAFLMAYYNGEYLSKVGWGLIQPEDWPLLGNLTREDQMVRFGCTGVAKYVAKPLLSYIEHIFLEGKHKVTLLVGDDSNVNSVLAAIGIKPYNLEGQQELSPIGGKVVFEKWYNGIDYYMKIKYVYLTTEQIRNGSRLSIDNPVRVVNLELNDVEVNDQGHCLFVQFMKILENVLTDIPF